MDPNTEQDVEENFYNIDDVVALDSHVSCSFESTTPPGSFYIYDFKGLSFSQEFSRFLELTRMKQEKRLKRKHLFGYSPLLYLIAMSVYSKFVL